MSKDQFFNLRKEQHEQEPRYEAAQRVGEESPQTYGQYVNTLSDDEVVVLFDTMKHYPRWATKLGIKAARNLPDQTKIDWYRTYANAGRVNEKGWIK